MPATETSMQPKLRVGSAFVWVGGESAVDLNADSVSHQFSEQPTQSEEGETAAYENSSYARSGITPDDDPTGRSHTGVLPLFEEDDKRPKVNHTLQSIYNPIIPAGNDTDAKPEARAKMGTFMGVYLPCLQNIFGVLFFIRLAWIIGTAGVIQAFFICLICCMVTFLTSISLSAIATNGIVPSGGPYYMISRNLGPELGGAIGILFYLGTTVAASMYIIGAVEIAMFYLYPDAKIFDDTLMCFRMYGTALLLLLGLIVMAGVRVVNKFALPTVIIVVTCIVLVFVGTGWNFNGKESLQYCRVGDRLVNMKKWIEEENPPLEACNRTELRKIFCKDEVCDPYFEESGANVGSRRAIKGIASGVFIDNIDSKYQRKGWILNANSTIEPENEDSVENKYYVSADITTGFMILIGVFFPSVTGIMAGSNRSGDLADASKSIPLGTIAATVTTSIVYLSAVLILGAAVEEMFIRDKFGDSAQGALVVAQFAAVPHPKIIVVGCLCSTLGAGLQSLTGAPRLFQAIAQDGVIPIMSPFVKTTKAGEPFRAILLTLAISEIGILIAQLENITALISQFFLMCYCGVNTACALQSLLKSPGWRPRFKYYHWSLSLTGSVLCVAVMFISHWVFAIFAIVVGAVVYKYIEYRGAEKEWGDGLNGLGLSAARFALLNLEDRPPHTKNWRPQILVLFQAAEIHDDDANNHLVGFVAQLKAGRGLTVLSSVIPGTLEEHQDIVESNTEVTKQLIKKHKVRGFCDVVVTRDRMEGISCLIQTSGLGALRHNTLVTTWPENWRDAPDVTDQSSKVKEYVDTIRVAAAANCAILLLKNVHLFPLANARVTAPLDVWWILNDGGMLLLLPFLLQQHRVWRAAKLRIFTIAQMGDDAGKMKEELTTFLYHLRIQASVEVIEMHDSDISEYTHERMMKLWQHQKLLGEMDEKQLLNDPQIAVFDPRTRRRSSSIKAEEIDKLRIMSSHQMVEEEVAVMAQPNGTNNLTAPDGGGFGADNLSTSMPSLCNIQPVAEMIKTDNTSSQTNIRRMHTAVKLNELMKAKSKESQLIIVNLPEPSRKKNEHFYMEFVEALTEDLDRVLLIKGTGSEVVTIYS